MESLCVIAHIQNAFSSKFGIPRQSSLVKELVSMVVFEREYRNPDALRGLDQFSHIWLLWEFSQVQQDGWSPMVRPPKLGGNTRVGVFASRSPFRPNAIGLSSVKLDKIEQHPSYGPVLYVSGADLMNGTPIYDIKPYVPYSDSHPDAVGGFALEPSVQLQVAIPAQLLKGVSQEEETVIRQLLAHDPRPSYQNDPERIYGMAYGGYEVKFVVKGDVLTVVSIESVSGVNASIQ